MKFRSDTIVAGCGRTSVRLARDLLAVARIKDLDSFFSVTCCLHGLSLIFNFPDKKYFLLRGLGK